MIKVIFEISILYLLQQKYCYIFRSLSRFSLILFLEVDVIYFLSDPHFGHVKILQYEPKRQTILGQNIQEHDSNLLKRINSRVRENDILVVVGDFSLGGYSDIKKYRSEIQCKNLWLVLGNHDKASISQYYASGFSVVCHEIVLKIAGEFVRVAHYPYKKPWHQIIFPWQKKEKDRKKRPRNYGGWLLHGHIHSGMHRNEAWKVFGRKINVGVDVWEYYPVAITEVESIISREKNRKIGWFKRFCEKCLYL